MRAGLTIIAAGALAGAAALAEEAQRELSAHEHGRASLKIAVEGDKVLMDFASPGVNIVGFEQVAETDEQLAAVEAAKARLTEPLTLWVLPAEAGCSVDDAAVEVVTEEDEHEGEHDHAEAEDDEPEHNEYRAVYQLTCSDPAAVNSVRFAFFDVFPATEQFDLTVALPSGQNSYRVERATPQVAISGQS